jgi:glycosyltransferase 2 family protein
LLYYAMGRTDIIKDNASISHTNNHDSRNWRQVLPGLIVSAIAIAVLIYIVDLERFVQAWGSADYRMLLLAVLVTLIWLVVRGFVWRTLLEEKASYSAVFWTLNEGYLLNNLLPFRLGEVGRAFLLSRKSVLGFWQVLSSILIERALDLAFAVGLLLFTLPLVVDASWALQAALGSALLIALVFAVMCFLARNSQWAMSMFKKLSARWPFLLKMGQNAIPSFLAGLGVLTDSRRFLRAIGWMTINWLVTIVQYFIVISAFISDPELLMAAFTLAVGVLGIAAPSSPGAVGVYELAIVGALALFSINASVALAIAFTLHFIAYSTTGVLGVYALVSDGETLLGIYRQVKRVPEDHMQDR